MTTSRGEAWNMPEEGYPRQLHTGSQAVLVRSAPPQQQLPEEAPVVCLKLFSIQMRLLFPEMHVCKLEVLLPVKIRHIVSSSANVIAHALHDWFVNGRLIFAWQSSGTK